MKQLTVMITAAAMLALLSPAHAGSNTCEGTVAVGKEWTTVKGDGGDMAPAGCRFKTGSKLGRRILAACPDGSECLIDAPLNNRSPTLTAITNVQMMRPSEAEIRKLCPDPNARCKARDNPDFYRETK